MRAEIKADVSITLTMAANEAIWLRAYLQNPMLSVEHMPSEVYNIAFDNAPDNEDPLTREMRHAIFNALPSDSDIANCIGN